MSALRVLHVAKFPPGTPGGMERFVDALAHAQLAAGRSPAVFAYSDPRGDWTPPARDFPVFHARAFGQALFLPLSPGYPFALHRAIARFDPDVLHFHLPNPAAFLALAVPSARKRRWVAQWQADIDVEDGHGLVSAIYRPFAWLESRFLARCDAIVASSRAYAEASAPLARHRERVVSIPLGLDFAAPHAAPAHDAVDWGDATLRVLCIARLVPYKGVDVLVDAVASLPNARVVVIGTGPERERLAARAAPLCDRVHLEGHVSDAALEAWLETCDVLCLPSVNRHEAFGMTLLEAARAGKPAIATSVPGAGMAEVIDALGAGWVVPPGDAPALRAALADAAARKRDGTLWGPSPERLARFDIAVVERAIWARYPAR